MNSLIIIFITGLLFFLGYRFYTKKLERLFGIDPQRLTPAVKNYNGIDYVPAKNWLVLFGHHFSSIAGAGPILGPVLACVFWGWGPALIWVVLGTILIGGVHDFSSLITSVRQDGSSVAKISEEVISKRAKVLFSSFVLLALILVISVFTFFCAETFVKEPKIVLPSLGLIPVAVLVGFLLYPVRDKTPPHTIAYGELRGRQGSDGCLRQPISNGVYHLKVNSILATILGLILLFGLIVLGNYFPIKSNLIFWSLVLILYCYIASIIPVQILLQPRDYLSAFLLFFGVGTGYLCLLISNPVISLPLYTQYRTEQGLLWPMLCVTVACGAISGFHSLISSGTTSKQLSSESYAKRIGYGAMIAEGLVAVLAILVIATGIKTDLLSTFKKTGAIATFGTGYGEITKLIFGGFGGFIAITILNSFILTTLDTATRISRYITEELFRIKNRYLSTLIVVILGGSFALYNAFSQREIRVWKLFGAANQLVASLALFVVSCWLLKNKKNLRYTIIPAIFMLITTVSALIYQSIRYLSNRDYLLLVISFILIGLAFFMLIEVIKLFIKKKYV